MTSFHGTMGIHLAKPSAWTKIRTWITQVLARRRGAHGSEILDDRILRDIVITRFGIREDMVTQDLEARR